MTVVLLSGQEISSHVPVVICNLMDLIRASWVMVTICRYLICDSNGNAERFMVIFIVSKWQA